ncbi:YccF domain-containing protein [Enterococcus sp. LJL99]
MGVLDWSFVSFLALAILFLFLAISFLGFFLMTNAKYKANKNKRIKNKKKRRKFLSFQKKLQKKKNKELVKSIIFLCISLTFLGGSYYTRTYQQNHLDGEDSQAILQSYFLLQELQSQLENIQKNENPQKSIKNIKEISSRLASYGSRKASGILQEDGQNLLNRHYQLLREIGVNLNNQTLEMLQESSVNEAYVNDAKKVTENQKKVFERFKINEKALKKKK